jgi:hypothetical protein
MYAGMKAYAYEETDMDWLSQNWIWVLVFAAFIGMHLFGHGGHGGHGGGDQRPTDGEKPGKDRPQGHQH